MWRKPDDPGYLGCMLLLLLACAESAVLAPPRAAPDAPGPYGIGVQTLVFTDARGKELVAELWYPAQIEPGSAPDPYPEIPITLDAHRDAPPDARGAPYPLIAFSHGMGGIRYQSAFLTEYLASHGYVTIAVDHTHNTFLDMDEDRMVQVFLERPGDVTSAVDEVYGLAAAGDPTLGGLLDPDAGYAMMGHSFGAWTAMVVGGGTVDLASLTRHCAEGDDGIACNYLANVEETAVDIPEANDPRVRTTLPLSPGVWYSFGPQGEGLAEVRAPFVLAGDADTVLSYPDEIEPTFAAMSAPKRMGTLAGGGHYAFTDICRIAAPLFDDCDEAEAGFIEMDRAHAITRAVVTAHLDLTLLGAADAGAWLTDDWAAQSAPELRWSSEP